MASKSEADIWQRARDANAKHLTSLVGSQVKVWGLRVGSVHQSTRKPLTWWQRFTDRWLFL